jgi:hypothetical protein
MNILPLSARVFQRTKTDRQTEGRTDLTVLTVAFRNFADTPKKWTENK